MHEPVYKGVLKVEKRDWNELADVLKSIAHCDRLAIIYLLYNSHANRLEVKDIYNTLRLEQSTTSRHLNIMRRGGLLKREVKNGKTYYCFNLENNAALCLKEMLEQFL